MFENKWKEKYEQIEQRLKETTQELVNIAQSKQDVYVVKLFPENTDQFELDGEFVVDPTTAVYGSHPLTFSEAVLFKAGKEAAAREYAKHLDKIQGDLALSEERVVQLKNEIDATQALVKERDESIFNAHAKLSEQKTSYEQRIEKLENTVNTLTSNIDKISAESSQQIQELQAEVEKWRDLALREPSHFSAGVNIETPCGVVFVPSEVVASS